MNATAAFSAITSLLGVHANTTTHTTQRSAEMAARAAIKSGAADSAAIYVKDDSTYGNHAVSYLGASAR